MQKRYWEYDEHERVYVHHFGRCVAHIWQNTNDLWDAMIESGRRHAVRNDFLSYAEAEAWVAQHVEDASAAERRTMQLAS